MARHLESQAKNFLFVGHEAAGENLAGLYALVATCEVNGINPEEYLADVLLRVQTHPNSRLGELLPHEWKRLRAAPLLPPPGYPLRAFVYGINAPSPRVALPHCMTMASWYNKSIPEQIDVSGQQHDILPHVILGCVGDAPLHRWRKNIDIGIVAGRPTLEVIANI
jgi:hypothetical protein